MALGLGAPIASNINKPPTLPVNGTASSSTIGGTTKGTAPTPTLGTSSNPIYGSGSGLMASINSLTAPKDRGAHPNRKPKAPVTHVDSTWNYQNQE
jgi:hypothetical protein